MQNSTFYDVTTVLFGIYLVYSANEIGRDEIA